MITVKDYLETLIKNGHKGTKVYYRSQEGDGDNAVMEIEQFIQKYGNRKMGDYCSDDFCMADGTRNFNQYIKRIG